MRPPKHETWLMVAHTIAGQGTCRRRRTGCVLLDEHWQVLSTGYNGPAQGLPHCIDSPCPGVDYKQGDGLDKCEAIHAEQNALLTCADISKVRHVCCTTAPCIHCTKMLLRSGAQWINFIEDYPNNSGRELWERAGRMWVHARTTALLAVSTMTCGTMPEGLIADGWLRFNDRGNVWSKP